MKPSFRKSRDFKYFNLNNFNCDLENSIFCPMYESINIDEKIAVFNDIILQTFNRHAPVRSYRVSKNNAPWLTDNLKFMVRDTCNAFRKYKKTKSCHKYLYYKDLKNLVNKTKEKLVEYKLKNSKSKSLWNDLKHTDVYEKRPIPPLPENLCDVSAINAFFINATKTSDPDLEIITF
nr:unnamed protein product [Callosobruchus analis]